jgi:hypothetical protein
VVLAWGIEARESLYVEFKLCFLTGRSRKALVETDFGEKRGKAGTIGPLFGYLGDAREYFSFKVRVFNVCFMTSGPICWLFYTDYYGSSLTDRD